jgi:hypothetical protein
LLEFGKQLLASLFGGALNFFEQLFDLVMILGKKTVDVGHADDPWLWLGFSYNSPAQGLVPKFTCRSKERKSAFCPDP